MLKDFNRIYAIEIDLNKLETTYNSNALFANTDLNTSTLLVKLILDGKLLDVTDKIVTAYIRTGVDKNVTMQKCEFVEEGVVGIDFKNSALKVGTNVFFIEIKSVDGEVINTPLINYKVVELFDISDSIEGENEENILTQIISEIQIVKNVTDDLKEEFLSEVENTKEKIEVINSNIKTINENLSIKDNKIAEIEYKNTLQDGIIKGLLNESADGRLTIESFDSFVSLENSKKGMVTIDKIIGKTTLVNSKLESTFESGLVTQGMIDNKLEKLENLGKYKIPIKIYNGLLTAEEFISERTQIV